MADSLYDLLTDSASPSPRRPPDAALLEYLKTLASRSLSSLATTEPQSLSQSSHSLLLALQSLSKKSHKPIIDSATHHATLRTSLPALAASTADLRNSIPKLDNEVVRFSTTYNKSGDNPVLARRRQAMLLSRNVERVVDILELPTYLTSAITSQPPNYASALDLNGHIRRLHSLYPASPLVASISASADDAMRLMASNLLQSLKSPSLKLAASLRTISFLRRLLPDLTSSPLPPSHQSSERVLGGLFLVSRLATLTSQLEALAPLRDLADQERARQRTIGSGNAWSGGQQTERYLKRYVEIFREQSFAVVSMFRSIFPSSPSRGEERADDANADADEGLEPLPSALATFPLYLVDMLMETLRLYLPTVKDQASRDSLLTQVLYCASSLGRLGGDFGLFLAGLDVGREAEDEWVEVVKRHRLLAGRLESIVGEKGHHHAKAVNV